MASAVVRRVEDTSPVWVCANLTALLAQVRFDIRDRKYHLRKYKDCFVAREAVDMFMDKFAISTREKAVRLGQTLVHLGVITHVVEANKPFMDKYLFFRVKDPFRKHIGGETRKRSFSQTSSSSSGDAAATILRAKSLPPRLDDFVDDTSERKSKTRRTTESSGSEGTLASGGCGPTISSRRSLDVPDGRPRSAGRISKSVNPSLSLRDGWKIRPARRWQSSHRSKRTPGKKKFSLYDSHEAIMWAELNSSSSSTASATSDSTGWEDPSWVRDRGTVEIIVRK